MKKYNVNVNGKTYQIEIEEVENFDPKKAQTPSAPAASAAAPAPARHSRELCRQPWASQPRNVFFLPGFMAADIPRESLPCVKCLFPPAFLLFF